MNSENDDNVEPETLWSGPIVFGTTHHDGEVCRDISSLSDACGGCGRVENGRKSWSVGAGHHHLRRERPDVGVPELPGVVAASIAHDRTVVEPHEQPSLGRRRACD